MVIIILIGVFIALIVAFVLVIQYPELLSQITTYVDALIYYLGQAMDIVWIFVPKTITIALMSIAIAIEVIYLGYQLVMWILKKIPVANIK